MPSASRTAAVTSAEPATTPQGAQLGRLPLPRSSWRPEDWIGCEALSISALFVVVAGDDRPRAHVGDEGDREEDEPGGDQGVDREARGLGEVEGDVGGDR